MGTANSSYVLEEELGVLPRAIRHLFECIEASKTKAEFLVREYTVSLHHFFLHIMEKSCLIDQSMCLSKLP